MAPVKRLSSPLSTFCLPVLAGLLMAWGIVYLPFLIKLEHAAFIYPEKISTDQTHNSLRYSPGDLKDFTIEATQLASKYNPGSGQNSYLLDEETTDLLGASSLTAANWTFIVNSLVEKGVKHLFISQELSWENPDELTLRALEYELSQLDSFAVGINLQQGAIAQELPPFLEGSIIPSSNQSLVDLPEVNQINLHPSVSAQIYGFNQLDQAAYDEDEHYSYIPLLAHWGNHLLPSLELASILTRNKIAPANVIFRHGLFLQLGENGLIIPIDKHGRTKIPRKPESKSPSASSLLVPTKHTFSLVSLASPEAPFHLKQLPYSHYHLANLVKESTNRYARLPLWKETAFLIIFVLILHRRKWWLTAAAALAYFAFPFTSGEWLLFSPPITAALAFTILKNQSGGIPIEDSPPAEESEAPRPEKPEESLPGKLPQRHSSSKRQATSSKDRLAKKKRTH